MTLFQVDQPLVRLGEERQGKLSNCSTALACIMDYTKYIYLSSLLPRILHRMKPLTSDRPSCRPECQARAMENPNSSMSKRYRQLNASFSALARSDSILLEPSWSVSHFSIFATPPYLPSTGLGYLHHGLHQQCRPTIFLRIQ